MTSPRQRQVRPMSGRKGSHAFANRRREATERPTGGTSTTVRFNSRTPTHGLLREAVVIAVHTPPAVEPGARVEP